MEKEKLVELAIEAMELSYSPYSKFKVGAALVTNKGDVYLGANIENAAYGCTMCGERNAIYNAYMHNVKKDEIEALAIVGDTKEPISPCGQCRQVISELFPKNKPIYLSNLNKKIMTVYVKDILPYGFDDKDLK
ncbi:MAG: cytidine deaminase [Bacillales bacterium]